MKMRRIHYAVIAIFALVLLVGCKAQKKTVELVPFIEGTEGVILDFMTNSPPAEAFDGGENPFDAVVRLENKGEFPVTKDKVRVKLSGVNPAEFNKLEENFVRSPEDDLTEVHRDPQGNIIKGSPVPVEFKDLNYVGTITGAAQTFPLRAEVCYGYQTKAVTKACIRENILNPAPGGICEVNEAKTAYSSGSPIKIENVKESALAKDKIGFSFDVRHVGTGTVFEKDSKCLASKRFNDKAYVVVDVKAPGIRCTGLTTKGNKAEGPVTMFDNVKTISCTYEVTTKADYEQQISITVDYDYQEEKTTQITIKHTPK